METVRDYLRLKQAIPNQGLIGKCVFNRKNIGELHPGHDAIVNDMVANCDTSLMIIWSWEPIYNSVFPNDTAVVPEPAWDGESYMSNWAESMGVDILFIPPFDYHTQLFLVTSAEQVLELGDTLIAAEGYDFGAFATGTPWNQFRMTIGAEELWNTSVKYPKDYQPNSYKDGPIVFLYKHYIEKYHGCTYNIMPTVLRPDGLPYSSSLLTARQELIDFAVDCHNTVTEFTDLVTNFNWETDVVGQQSPIIPDEFKHLINSYTPNEIPFDIKIYENETFFGIGKKFIEVSVQGLNLIDGSIKDQAIRLSYLI
jgi:hypothetical protein